MPDEDDLTRGRPAWLGGIKPPFLADGTNLIYSNFDKQDAVNRDVDDKLSDLYRITDSLTQNSAFRRRVRDGQIEKMNADIFLLQRQYQMLRMWVIFLGIMTLVTGLSVTIAWVVFR